MRRLCVSGIILLLCFLKVVDLFLMTACLYSVTMPIKTAIIPYLDGLTPEASSTGAVNTIVKVPDHDQPSTYKLIGTNTDIFGVKNALLRALHSQHSSLSQSKIMSPQARYPKSARGAGVVIGGGATTRSAVHALWTMGLEKLYLVNRDAGEVEAGIFFRISLSSFHSLTMFVFYF